MNDIIDMAEAIVTTTEAQTTRQNVIVHGNGWVSFDVPDDASLDRILIPPHRILGIRWVHE